MLVLIIDQKLSKAELTAMTLEKVIARHTSAKVCAGDEWLKDSLEEIVKEVSEIEGTDTRGAIRDCMTGLLSLADKNGMDYEARHYLLEGAKEVKDEEDGILASYVSVWSNGVTIESKCRWFPDLKVVRNIEKSETDTGDATLQSEYVELADGTQYSSEDGVEFEY